MSVNPYFTDWYKMYPGLTFSYLFFEVPLTQNYHYMMCMLFLVCCFFQIQLDHFVATLVKNVSNTCFAKTYYINRLNTQELQEC